MKRMWKSWLVIVTLMTMVGAADAQNGWNQPSEIGSYQSILSRAGYGNGMGILNRGLQSNVPLQGSAISSGNVYGGALAQGGGVISSGSGTHGGGATYGGGGAYGGGGIYGGSVQSLPGSAIHSGAAVQSSGIGSAQVVGQGSATFGSSTRPPAPTVGSSTRSPAPMVGSSTREPGSFGSSVGTGIVDGPMSSGQIMSSALPAPITSGFPIDSSGISSAPAISAPVFNDTSSFGGSVVGNSFGPAISAAPVYSSAPVYSAPSFSAPVYSSPVYQQSVVAPVYTAGRQRAARNYTAGITGLFFQRDYEDNRFLARNPRGDTLFTNDADEQTFDGFGVNVGSRGANGNGFEVRYWALNPGRVVASLSGVNVATNIRGLDQLLHVSSGRDLFDIYSNTVAQTVVRDTDINNLEFNFLRNGGNFSSRKGRHGFFEMFGGFRWFQFDEGLQYTASIDNGQFPLVPSDFFYNLETRNTLLGLQAGCRTEFCISSKFRLFGGLKGGLFNNNINTVQNITDLDGEIAQVNAGAAAGRPFSYNVEKNDLAFLGELDWGVLYQLTSRSRLRLGYRVIGVSGVALAADQIPFSFTDPGGLTRANSNGSLILGGGYYGIEFCF